MGLPRTGRRVSISGVDIGRFAGGRGVEHWASMDPLGLLQHVGAIEADQALEASVRT
jgi:predicted ester cyclase